MKTIDKVLEIWILLVGLGYIVASVAWQIIGNVDEKFISRFFFGMFCLSVYAILRRLKIIKTMFDLKQDVIDSLVEDGYDLEKATKDVEEATVSQQGNIVKITYKNGAIDNYEIVKSLKLK